MGADDVDNDVQRLWRDQPSEEVHMSAQEVRRLAEKFERTISRRNRREYIAAAFVVVWFGVWAWFAASAVVALGCCLVAAAALWVVFYLQHRGAARHPAGEREGLHSGLEFLRSELVRQRDLLRSVWWWYLLPFVPGMLLILVGDGLKQPDRYLLAPGILLAVTFVGIGLLNQRGARKLQQRIDVLDAVRRT
jgi:hypothetical protein